MIKRAMGPAQPWRTPSAGDKAYAAGFFDGEGNVVIAANRKGGARGTYLTYNMRVGVSQNDPAPLFWLRERWGGSVRKTGPRAHLWQQFASGAARFLQDVEPYLQVKRERAWLAIHYQTSIVRRGRVRRTPEEAAALAAVKAEMNRLNKREARE